MMRCVRAAVFAMLLPFVSPLAQKLGSNALIVGAIGDSVSGAPLSGAEIVVSGVANSVITDSLGKFAVTNLAPGTYQVGVFHPLLESLGITLATQPFVLGPDSAAVVNLSVPSVATLVRRYCGEQQTASAPSSVAGQVLDPDTDAPIAGARVSLAWTDVRVTKEEGVVRAPHERHAETDASGLFRLCALPSDLDGTLQVSLGQFSTPEVPISMNGALLAFQSMSLPAKTETSSTGVVTGRVVAENGKPVAGARVDVPVSGVSTVTRSDGGFRLAGVLTGTQMLVVRSLSYALAGEPIIVTSRAPLDVVVTLGPKVNIMEPVLVTARSSFALEKAGFNARKKRGAGHFFTREEIDRRKPNNISDMMKNLSGINVTRGRGGTVISGRTRVTSVYSGGGSCTRAYVDGFEWRDLMPGDLDLFINPDDVIGLEIYQPGEVPAQFRTFDRGCVTIVAWTQFRGKAKK